MRGSDAWKFNYAFGMYSYTEISLVITLPNYLWFYSRTCSQSCPIRSVVVRCTVHFTQRSSEGQLYVKPVLTILFPWRSPSVNFSYPEQLLSMKTNTTQRGSW